MFHDFFPPSIYRISKAPTQKRRFINLKTTFRQDTAQKAQTQRLSPMGEPPVALRSVLSLRRRRRRNSERIRAGTPFRFPLAYRQKRRNEFAKTQRNFPAIPFPITPCPYVETECENIYKYFLPACFRFYYNNFFGKKSSLLCAIEPNRKRVLPAPVYSARRISPYFKIWRKASFVCDKR